jgi:hypothetical protein
VARPFITIALACAVALLQACAHLRTPGDAAAAKQNAGRTAKSAEARMRPAELEQALYAYADRYAVHIVAATDAIGNGNPSAEQRRVAHLVKLGTVSSAYDIASGADPLRKLVDMTLMVTLQSYVWIDEDRAERTFGDRAEPLIRELRQLRVDIWKLAAQVLRPDELQLLDSLILDWRRQHPDLAFVAFLRFDDVSAEGNREVLEEFKRSSGMFGIAEATQAIDQMRLLGERTLFHVKRMPYLVSWQGQAALNEALAQPELAQLLQSSSSLARSAERMTALAEKLPGQLRSERLALIALLEDRNGRLSMLLSELRKLTESGERLSLNVRDSVRAVEALQLPQSASGGGTSKPFDIDPYLTASAELNQTVAGVNSALAQLDGLFARGQWLQDANASLAGHIDRIFIRVLILIAAFFALLTAYRLLTARLARRP